MEAIINKEQISRVAEIIKNLPDEGYGCNWYSYKDGNKEIIDPETYPPLSHPRAVNFFFFVCLHDYGFWHGDDKGYLEPIFDLINGKKEKGSILMWKAVKRALDQDETILEPHRLLAVEPEELFRKIFRVDAGPIIFPDPETRFRRTRGFVRWLLENNLTPSKIVADANRTGEPLRDFLRQLRPIPGYKYTEDIFEKRNLLLAMVLANRPEKFLKVKDPENWKPLVDYHVMRISLRLGMVELDEEEREINRQRRWTSVWSERKIRECSYEAFKRIIRQSGRPMTFVDEKIWHARSFCPEMTEPDCPKCIFADVCKKRIELFQPVFRTTAY